MTTTAPIKTLADEVRKDFPALHQTVHGKPLAYLDNGGTAQKPQTVIDTIKQFYENDNANIHRGIHTLSERATEAFENVRQHIARYLNAANAYEIVFVKGATEAINLVAQSYLMPRLEPGDDIIVTEMEHHANLVPWQRAAKHKGANIKAIPVLDNGELDLDTAKSLFSERTKMLTVSHISNVLGTINPVERLVELAHSWGVTVMVDGAQAAPHERLDMQAIGCDFYAVSAHKMYGPTGVGVLYGRYELLNSMEPYQSGGNMIVKVGIDDASYRDAPEVFESGTPHIAGVMGLQAAMNYLESTGFDHIKDHERQLRDHAHKQLQAIDGLTIYGQAADKAAVISFVVNDVHPHDLATVLDTEGIAVRAGHHCAMPLMTRFGVPAMLRASMAFYNTFDEIDRLSQALDKTVKLFRGV